MEKETKIYVILAGVSNMDPYQPHNMFRCTREEADEMSFEYACEIYESFAGLHGLRDVDQIMEEDECDAEEAEQTFNDERESWLEYGVEELDLITEEHDFYDTIMEMKKNYLESR